MLDSNLQELRVLDYPTALQVVQGLESRGDFQYKGVHKVFLLASEMADKYLSNRILPTADQLARDVGIEKSKIELFIKELCLKYNPPIFKMISAVEFDPTSQDTSGEISSFVKRKVVFCRPSHLDSGSAHRYVNFVNEVSVNAIKKWITTQRKPKPLEKMQEIIFAKIESNKLTETYASYEIGSLFSNPYDATKEMKEVTININLKPILKDLVDGKQLFFFRNDNAIKAGSKSVFLYNNKEEIFNRMGVYSEFLKTRIIPDLQKIGVIGDLSKEEKEDFATLGNLAIPYLNDSYGDQKTIVQELLILSDFYKSYLDEKEKKEKKEKLQEIISALESAGKIVDVEQIKIKGEPIDRNMVAAISSHENILFTEYADKGREYFEYVLHKNCVPQAIAIAKRTYNSTKNDTEIRILSRMNVMDLADAELKREFEELESRSFFNYLPIFTRIWRSLFGLFKVSKQEKEQIKAKQEVLQRQRIASGKVKKMEKEKAKIVESRMKKEDGEELDEMEESSTISENLVENSTEGENDSPMNTDQERQVKETLQKIVDLLDNAWNAGEYPDRTYLLQKLGSSMTEDAFVMFLKKHSHKEIYSYQIKSKANPDKYPWPILISRHYLKRFGKKLLDKAKIASDEQRSSLMPNQEKFDLSSSLEEFLERVLPKI